MIVDFFKSRFYPFDGQAVPVIVAIGNKGPDFGTQAMESLVKNGSGGNTIAVVVTEDKNGSVFFNTCFDELGGSFELLEIKIGEEGGEVF